MIQIGKQGIGKPKPTINKPENVSGAEIMRRERMLIKQNDKHSKDQATSPELPTKS